MATNEFEELLDDIRVKSMISEDSVLMYITHEELDVTVAIQSKRGDAQTFVLASILGNLPEIILETVQRHINTAKEYAQDPLEELWRSSNG